MMAHNEGNRWQTANNYGFTLGCPEKYILSNVVGWDVCV